MFMSYNAVLHDISANCGLQLVRIGGLKPQKQVHFSRFAGRSLRVRSAAAAAIEGALRNARLDGADGVRIVVPDEPLDI